jgi:hypothetical protein
MSARSDLIPLIVALALGGILAFVSARYVDLGRLSNYGFGPEWQCTRQARGDPICIRK